MSKVPTLEPHHPEGKKVVGNQVAIEEMHMFKPNFHTYFDGPDDENFVHKNKIMLKYTGLATLFTTVADVCLWERVGIVPVTQRAIFWGYPIIGGGLAYTFALSAVAGIRKKDDKLNHFIAGLAAGSVVGAANRCINTGLLTGIALGMLGTFYKASKQEGWDMFQDLHYLPKEVGYPMSYKHDCTIIKDFPQRWVRELPKEDDC